MTSARDRVLRPARWLLAIAACTNGAAGAVLALRDPARAVDLWAMYDWCRWWLGGARLYTMADATTDYPPNAIVLLSPLARIPHGWIVPLWTAGSLILAPVLAWCVVRCASRADRRALAVPVLLFLCWTSARTLLQFSVLSMTLAFASLLIVDSSWMWSGVLLGLALFKPHIAGPVALWVALTGRLRVVIAAGVVVAAGWTIFDAHVGEWPLATLGGYWRVLGDQYGGREGLTGATSIRAWTHAAAATPGAADAWWLGLSALLLAGIIWLARRDPRRALDEGGLAVPAMLCLWSLLSVYHNINNLILMLPAFAFLWYRDDRRARPIRWVPLVLMQAVLMVDVPTRLAGLAPREGWLSIAIGDFDRLVVVSVLAWVGAVWYQLTRRTSAG
jgi:hypothetical protein